MELIDSMQSDEGNRGVKVATSVCTGGSNSPPDCCIHMGSIPHHLKTDTNKKYHPLGWYFLLVEMRGIEPLSESNLTRLSPGAVCYLHSLTLTRTNTLQSLVAS